MVHGLRTLPHQCMDYGQVKSIFYFVKYLQMEKCLHMLDSCVELLGNIGSVCHQFELLIYFESIATVVTIAEILKNNGLAVEKSIIWICNSFALNTTSQYNSMFYICPMKSVSSIGIMTSTIDIKDESRGRPIQKAKIEILLGKTANFDELMAAAADEGDAVDGEEQS